jgi:hypothetical protein
MARQNPPLLRALFARLTAKCRVTYRDHSGLAFASGGRVPLLPRACALGWANWARAAPADGSNT